MTSDRYPLIIGEVEFESICSAIAAEQLISLLVGTVDDDEFDLFFEAEENEYLYKPKYQKMYDSILLKIKSIFECSINNF